MRNIKKIVVIGPESTGKSTLCEHLAAHFRTAWCPEYSREYLLKNGLSYNYKDLLTIAKCQVNLENEMHSQAENGLLFIDTDLYVMKVWSEFVFGRCDSWILDEIARRKYDLYLLCDIDLPWQKDVLREHPDLKSRQKLYHIYRDILINQPAPWLNINGTHEQRVHSAIEAVVRF
ncbi:MAG: ATP-binding protein [Chitinophagaceae bacterium]|nr:ATP-binding protein [Chitinophagaceae bacterium]